MSRFNEEVFQCLLRVTASLQTATKHLRLSPGAGASLALGIRLGFPVLTIDRTWQDIAATIEIEPIR
jgi:PIN domain nuclease of toxin-antitoxin system